MLHCSSTMLETVNSGGEILLDRKHLSFCIVDFDAQPDTIAVTRSGRCKIAGAVRCANHKCSRPPRHEPPQALMITRKPNWVKFPNRKWQAEIRSTMRGRSLSDHPHLSSSSSMPLNARSPRSQDMTLSVGVLICAIHLNSLPTHSDNGRSVAPQHYGTTQSSHKARRLHFILPE